MLKSPHIIRGFFSFDARSNNDSIFLNEFRDACVWGSVNASNRECAGGVAVRLKAPSVGTRLRLTRLTPLRY